MIESSFASISDDLFNQHMRENRYGDFVLTDAVRPSFDLKVIPSNGYREDIYRDEEMNSEIPLLIASVSCEKLLDIFYDIIDLVGSEVDVTLESSHEEFNGNYCRDCIDLPVLKSILYDFEDVLLNDGYVGIAVYNRELLTEVHLDEHKLLLIYAPDFEMFKNIFNDYGIEHSKDIRFIVEADHVHSSNERLKNSFGELRQALIR